MRLSALLVALVATLPAAPAFAAPIIVLNAEPAAHAAPAARCTTPPASANGPDVECIVTLARPASGAQAPSRILIRTEVGQPPCAPKTAHVVRLSGPTAAPRRLPVVEHARAGRGCGS